MGETSMYKAVIAEETVVSKCACELVDSFYMSAPKELPQYIMVDREKFEKLIHARMKLQNAQMNKFKE